MLDKEERFVYVVVAEYSNIGWTDLRKAFYTEREAVDYIYERIADPSYKNFREGELSFKFGKVPIE